MLEQEGKTVVTLAIDQVPQLIISLSETHLAKEESQAVVQYLQNDLNLKVWMITGDNKHSAFKVARYLGIDLDRVVYRAYPDTKRK